MNSYDRLPYPSYPYPLTHPDHLAMMATLLALDPPRDRYRVLELGCATGGNLIPMAVHRPDCQFVGIDYSTRQIEVGQQLIAELGLSNIDLHARSIMDVNAGDGLFDYILCHGVYSWVSSDIQAKILRICQEQLTPSGVAIISFNTHPGWRQRSALRDMMRFHVERSQVDSPSEEVQQARQLLSFLVQANEGSDASYPTMLREQHTSLQQHTDSYIYHEYLEEHNEPIWFLDFCERLQHHQLRFLADAEFQSMVSATRLPPELQQSLEAIAPDLLAKEQYMDFVRNRSFRQTLVCHAHCQPNYAVSGDRLESLFVASSGTIVQQAQSSPDEWTLVQGPLTFRTPVRATQLAFEILTDHWPARMAVADLIEQVTERLGHTDPSSKAACRSLLLKALLSAFASSQGQVLELSSGGLAATGLDEPLRVSPLVRQQLAHNLVVVSRRHTVVPITPIDRRILPQLDGQTSHAAILAELVRQYTIGDLTIHDAQDQPITDPPTVHLLLEQLLQDRLKFYCRSALI